MLVVAALGPERRGRDMVIDDDFDPDKDIENGYRATAGDMPQTR